MSTFYGFLAGEASQIQPEPGARTPPACFPPKTAEEGYHLSEDLADDAIGWLHRSVHPAEVIALKGDSYRLRNRDLGRIPTATTDQQ